MIPDRDDGLLWPNFTKISLKTKKIELQFNEMSRLRLTDTIN